MVTSRNGGLHRRDTYSQAFETSPVMNDKPSSPHRAEDHAVWSSGSYEQFPCLDLDLLSSRVMAACTGPDTGFTRIISNEDRSVRRNLLGCDSWSKSDESSYGISISLYDQNPITHKITGDPNADCFAVCTRSNSSVLVMCDGVNRGNKSRMAARAAVYGALKHINTHCFEMGEQPQHTHDVFVNLRRALDNAHQTICNYVHWYTTLTVVLSVPLASSEGDKFGICCISVGDSYAYIARNPHSQEPLIEELTIASHNFMEDLSQATGGAIGPVFDGKDPCLENLTYSFTIGERNDIVFAATDGVTDNFDPVFEKVAVPDLSNVNETVPDCVGQLPRISLSERQKMTVGKMADKLAKFIQRSEEQLSARTLCGELMKHALIISNNKRAVLEDHTLYNDLYKFTPKDIADVQRSKKVRALLSSKPGKLDHASVAAVQLRCYDEEDDSRDVSPAAAASRVRMLSVASLPAQMVNPGHPADIQMPTKGSKLFSTLPRRFKSSKDRSKRDNSCPGS